MQDVLVAEGKPLSEVERVVDTYIAPSKTFTDILLFLHKLPAYLQAKPKVIASTTESGLPDKS